jgi:type IV pilus assembly protein PilX
MLGVTAMNSTTMEERMAGNTRDSNLALEAAEAALRDAVRDIYANPYTGAYTRSGGVKASFFGDGSGTAGTCSTNGLCLPTAMTAGLNGIPPNAPVVSMTAAPSVEYGTFTNAPRIQGLAMQPRYIIENLCLVDGSGSMFGSSGPTTNCNYYRITARGYGMNPNSQATVQEVFLSAL